MGEHFAYVKSEVLNVSVHVKCSHTDEPQSENIHIFGPFFVQNNCQIAHQSQLLKAKHTISVSSMMQEETAADVSAQNLIRHAVPLQLCSSVSFSIALIKALNWTPARFYHFCVVLCSCTPPTLALHLSLHLPRFFTFHSFPPASSAFVTLGG